MRGDVDYSLYLVTDRTLMKTRTLEEAVSLSIDGGVTLVQLREKEASSREFYDLALGLKELTDSRGVPLIVNDRLDIALSVGAAGVHVGQKDLPASVVRRILGPGKVLGVSVSCLAQAKQAEEDGADYLGVGAMFATGTKGDADIVSMEELRRIREGVSIPLVIIGGINGKTLPLFRGTGIDGAAVVSAIIGADDVRGQAEKLKEIVLQVKEKNHPS